VTGQGALPLTGAPARRVWSVGELVEDAKRCLETTHSAIWVQGEVSNFRAQASGHWYFDLKDEHAVLPVAMFRGDNIGVPFQLEEGLEVTAFGRLSLFVRAGRFQLIANLLEPRGWGAQQLAFEQLKRKLDAEGLFDEQHKRPLPFLPGCVGVVTSSSGAAWHDMTRVWQRRQVGMSVLLVPATVQGDRAPAEIVAAIELLNHHDRADVVIVGRGGGSREDLWAFNDERVARAISSSRIPVISAVGHEIDVTIADLIADRRAATPTAAAEIVAPARVDLLRRLRAAARRAEAAIDRQARQARARLQHNFLRRALERPERSLIAYHQRLDAAWSSTDSSARRRLDAARSRLQAAASVTARHSPQRIAEQRAVRLRGAAETLQTIIRSRLHGARERLASTAARTAAMSPLAVLGRGYALCQNASGALVRDAGNVLTGDRVRVTVERGRLDCEVIARDVEKTD